MNPPAEQALQRLQHSAHRHRKSIFAVLVTALAGFTISAVAIAPLAPDAALLPRQLLAEEVQPQDIDAQLQALSALDLTLVRNDITRGTDTVDSLLARLGVSDPAAAAFMRSDATARSLLAGRGGRMVQALAQADGSLIELVARYPASQPEQSRTHFTRMTIGRIDGRWLARLETARLEATARMASGTIRSSLFAATDEAQIPDAVAAQIAEIFAADIDFHRELRRGDTFNVVYEALAADGEPIAWSDGTGRVLAAEFVNGGRTHQAVWFEQPGLRGAYYQPDGSSKRRSFLTSPMEFSRVSSGFSMRMHPILRTWRRHLGVDYAAPIGTPVRTVGDGVVSFAGWQNGYGNVVEIQHGGDRQTLYAHLSRIDVRRGQRIEQGQRVGAVGMTGWTTGPHLHFEFRVRGAHQDPLQIARSAETVPLAAQARPAFEDRARALQVKLEVADSLAGTPRRVE